MKHLILRTVKRRKPDFIVGEEDNPYLHRWWLIPRNPILNIYLHRFLRSDDDRALHDHPWWSISWLMQGTLREHTHRDDWSIRSTLLQEGCITVRSAEMSHRLELIENQHAYTLFITGPRIREWGFWCLSATLLPRWVHWCAFTHSDHPGHVGKGCDL